MGDDYNGNKKAKWPWLGAETKTCGWQEWGRHWGCSSGGREMELGAGRWGICSTEVKGLEALKRAGVSVMSRGWKARGVRTEDQTKERVMKGKSSADPCGQNSWETRNATEDEASSLDRGSSSLSSATEIERNEDRKGPLIWRQEAIGAILGAISVMSWWYQPEHEGLESGGH